MEDYLAVLKEVHQQLTSRNKKVSVKDTTLCPRKKVFSFIEPLSISDEEMCRYVSGEAAHDVLVRHFMMFPDRFRSQMQIQYENVMGRIDVYDKLCCPRL